MNSDAVSDVAKRRYAMKFASKDHGVYPVMNDRFRALCVRLFSTTALTFVVNLTSCGVAPQTDFPNRIVGADGQEFVLEDLEEIANDSRLTDDQKRDAFRNLGIADEELIDALLDL